MFMKELKWEAELRIVTATNFFKKKGRDDENRKN